MHVLNLTMVINNPNENLEIIKDKLVLKRDLQNLSLFFLLTHKNMNKIKYLSLLKACFKMIHNFLTCLKRDESHSSHAAMTRYLIITGAHVRGNLGNKPVCAQRR